MPPPQTLRPKRDDTLLTGWESLPERAPSLVRPDQPSLVRFLALVGMFLLLLGVLPIVMAAFWQRETMIGASWGFVLASIGLYLVVLHAYRERDVQFRQLYAILGVSLLAVGAAFRVLPGSDGIGTWFPLLGIPALTLGLIFLIAVLRGGAETTWRTSLLGIIGVAAAVLVVVPVGIGFFRTDYLASEGALVLLVGLCFVSAHLALQDPGDRPYYEGLALGVFGALVFVCAGSASLSIGNAFLVPAGLILMSAGLVFVGIALGACSDWPLVVIARRELASYFYSPIAYLVFAGMLIMGWITFFLYLDILISISSQRGGVPEPIFRFYVYNLVPVIVQIFVVPVITMRLLAEEKRTGSLEVLLTAPVNEWSVVLGKFLASWLFYLLLWIPSFAFLVAMRFLGGMEFDYYPILSFLIALLASSAGYISMGLFFSSVTSNQIVAAVFTFVGMMAHLIIHFLKDMDFITARPVLVEVLTYINYFDLWNNSAGGVLAPRYLLFHVSLAVFFLYLATQVLAARKWK